MSSLSQEIQYFEDPAPHFIIDNFLSTRMVSKCLEEVLKYKDKFIPADIGGSTTEYVDDCEACKLIREHNKLVKRQNDIWYMTHDSDFVNESIIVRGITDTLTDESFKSYIEKAPSMFPIMNNTDSIEALISRHGMCDFYGWHTDNTYDAYLMKKRIITVIYYFNTEPRQFKGGELTLAHPDIGHQKSIEPKNNRALIFLSQTLHCVNTVKLESNNFIDGRFGVNYWLGFK